MKTTIDIADGLLAELRRIGERDGLTMRELVDEGVRKVIAERSATRPTFVLRDASVTGGGPQPGIDLSNWEQLRSLIYPPERGG
jgi:hypothetical protein